MLCCLLLELGKVENNINFERKRAELITKYVVTLATLQKSPKNRNYSKRMNLKLFFR